MFFCASVSHETRYTYKNLKLLDRPNSKLESVGTGIPEAFDKSRKVRLKTYFLKNAHCCPTSNRNCNCLALEYFDSILYLLKNKKGFRPFVYLNV